jgi:hypothetical protein
MARRGSRLLSARLSVTPLVPWASLPQGARAPSTGARARDTQRRRVTAAHQRAPTPTVAPAGQQRPACPASLLRSTLPLTPTARPAAAMSSLFDRAEALYRPGAPAAQAPPAAPPQPALKKARLAPGLLEHARPPTVPWGNARGAVAKPGAPPPTVRASPPATTPVPVTEGLWSRLESSFGADAGAAAAASGDPTPAAVLPGGEAGISLALADLPIHARVERRHPAADERSRKRSDPRKWAKGGLVRIQHGAGGAIVAFRRPPCPFPNLSRRWDGVAPGFLSNLARARVCAAARTPWPSADRRPVALNQFTAWRCPLAFAAAYAENRATPAAPEVAGR